MYSYSFDTQTGGILLNSTPTNFSKEPRPVYSPEMELLGFRNYWDFDPQEEIPYLWAESTAYWYRGTLIARIKGGDLYNAPELQPVIEEDGSIPYSREKGNILRPIDIEAMCEKNKDLLTVIEDSTVKMIVKEYEKFNKKLDIFHVAFSGGKDSAVLLDLVKKALPKGSFIVIFGDTGMEFPDTYAAVEYTKQQCADDGTPFYTARSHFDPHDSWRIFGPPARVLRWCCSVHKSTPQTLKMREITGKDDYIGMDFVGVRAHESLARSKYEFENFGKKQKGQYSFNPILEWTSAEIWLYMFYNKIYINNTYRKGNARAGCLFCPMGGGASDYFRHCSYEKEIDRYISYIKDSYNSTDPKQVESYITNGGWSARKNGRDLRDNKFRCVESTTKHILTITVTNPSTDWKEWIKTLGMLSVNEEDYSIRFEGDTIHFQVKETKNGYVVSIPDSIVVEKPKFSKMFKQVFRKSAYCAACQVCETNCRNGCIKFTDGKLTITDCIHCYQCHMIDSGCLLFHSLRHPQGGGRAMKSLNSFADHAPKRDWLVAFFDLKEDFFTEHTLGPMMYDMFRRFLRDAGLNEKNHFTPFAELISEIGWESDTALGLMLVNLAMENPQIAWYINNMDIGYFYERNQIEERLIALDVKPKDAKSIVKAYKRITDTPFGTSLNFGYVTDDDDMVRAKCSVSDNRVILYALYKFAEKCNMDKEFHVSYLMDDTIDRDGVSPIRIFGLYDEEELKSILLGLSSAYPEYINATFTNDLKTITLRDKTSDDVLNLFRED
ncbi:phosphoadenosine phosphosulfate reductase family protein [Ruminococcus flavefaciens]|uniref:Phosphoadenosine phosphosulfate reductase n=2 Tax=Ruminococcus flavefaciens TaxID=1265 RepID=A0A1M7IGM7_RUMFL|nr:phosphoadenosine phosphosulfate reductase family protein [Ruminococcus flavefaciens]SEH73973.1 phosphoadenosine phosphosulfate reductase [Ruminococcus flavefaciens]SHM39901.1 phosphoadenosine phosphosulfate reductase [Ruminococcus flavefaciens]